MTHPSYALRRSHSVHTALLALAGCAALVAASVTAAAAPLAAPVDADFVPIKIEVNQSVQSGTTPLVAGRATFVRTTVAVTDAPPGTTPIDGLLRVFVNGLETADSPIYSDNGPFPAGGHSNPATENGTLNFIFLPPASNNVVLQVEINPAGPNFAAESDTADNLISTAPLTFSVQKVPELAYVPIDYRPSGGATPNLPPLAQIEPGMGDNFILGIYPTKDWYYHRTDAPSKLWTSSLAGSGSPLLDSLAVDINLMSPKPDFLYGFVPGGLSYNGQSVIGGNVSMGNTELIRFQRTIAHELGHNFGLQHNSITTGVIGVDVERHLHLTQNLGLIKAASLKDIMYAGLLTPEAWVWPTNYAFFFNHFVFDGGTDSDAPGAGAGVGSAQADATALLVTGLWNTATGVVELSHVLSVPGGTPSAPAAAGQADLVVRAFAGGVLVGELPILARGCDDSFGAQAPLVAFNAVLPMPAAGLPAIDRILVAQAGPALAQPAERRASASAPVAGFVSPAGGALPGSRFSLAWTASDADGDALRYYLRYSPDGSQRFVPIATGIVESTLDVDLQRLPALIAGRGLFELLVSDGFHTTRVRTAPLGALAAGGHAGVFGGQLGATLGGSPPMAYIVSPDTATSVLEGATVVLHGSSWDLDDNGLGGASLQWSSSLDGSLGQGRLLSVATLSPGAHVITLTATDGDGMIASDTATLTVIGRGLPTRGGETCQDDLGFGGPGGSVLSVCGGDLSTGTTADLLVTGAPPLTAALFFVGLSNTPTAFKGGTLVPLPVLLLEPAFTDASGTIAINGIPGGGGPLSVYLQCAFADGSQALGVGLSNVVRLDLLP